MSPLASSHKPPFVLHASAVARAHTFLSCAAFLSALPLACALHYERIVKNDVAGYPDEWFPSVSATIGDWYPERNIFQLLIAINAGPRFALSALQWYLHRTPISSIPGFVFVIGLLRTLSCGGWVFVTSSDHHDVHDVLMISYIVLNLPYMYYTLACTPAAHTAARKRRRLAFVAFFATIVPMVYFFIQHKVHRIPGAYTRYAFFEWGLIFFDVLYDSAAELDFAATDMKIVVSAPDTDQIVKSTATSEGAEKHASSEPSKWSVITRSVYSDDFMFEHVIFWPAVAFVSDVYLSYVFWSIYTSLAPTLFYFSIWELGISGQELTLLSTLAPAFLSIRSFREWALSDQGRVRLRLASFLGVLAYVASQPLSRLLLVTVANGAAALSASVEWFGATPANVAYQAMLAGVGFLLASVSKHANYGNNPIWPLVDSQSGGMHKTAIAFTVLAWISWLKRVPVHEGQRQAEERFDKHDETRWKNTKPPSPGPPRHWLRASLPLGALIFSLHSLLSDASTLIAWSWTGYPVTGPVPNQHGAITHIAQALGLAWGAALTGGIEGWWALAHPVYYALGAGGAYAMYAHRDWAGYEGGLVLAFFLMSIVPLVWARTREAAARAGLAKVAAVAWLVNALFDVASTFTVAYAFVPGGQYFRERTDMVLIAQFACLALAFDWPGTNNAPDYALYRSLKLPKEHRSPFRLALAVLVAVSLYVSVSSAPGVVPTPSHPGARIVRAGIWTVHFGLDNEGRDSQRAMRDLIRDMELDVVGLLETDLHRVVFGNRDLTRFIAEDLGYYVDIGPGPNQHTWGAVLLSKFPIINSTHHLLPSPRGELAPAIEAYLDMYGTPVKVVVAHNGQEEDPVDRELQTTEIARILADAHPAPAVFLGYLVTNPHASRPDPYPIMVEDGRVHDVDDEDLDRWCQYIFYRGLYRTAYARISRGKVTDTEMQVAQFVVPRHGAGVVDDGREARYLRSWKENLPEDHRFPMAYYPQRGGVNGHAYHVFDTPLYYNVPEGAREW
ncbi:Frag1/DRAM/Sfk1 family-domain-containing protein [Epithele typhae]|uniref:Frag1/DRAM/Sfk1 family-domain-containing protein n=1 Tax=Epithele typhae TaxID=378194 RepID=UPI002008157E|nr:Frag1/DRAM/Sfk1 family-domain-containing protein [Epithele typhae]KAH9945479.1 Frag1/DRAM/Sfk1 family-domain-containing protein [Epithele typhae]